jgi:hypothetical protein
MTDNVKPWPLSGPMTKEVPKPIVRPCDHGLELAVMQLETQVGTIEAYNRLVDKCRVLREQIERGHVKAQNPIFATSIRGE